MTCIYDSLNRLTSLVAKSANGTVASFAYKLAPAGNRTNLVETVNGTSRTNVWAYDPLCIIISIFISDFNNPSNEYINTYLRFV